MSARKLIQDIDHKIDTWNERSMFTLKGVKNLSMSDLDSLRLYAEQHISTGSFDGLMKPLGAMRDLLEGYDLL